MADGLQRASDQQFSAKTENDVRIWDGTGLKFFALHF
jgi:hypothetical protein